ncbi:anti-sigma factor antagonist [Kocuria dechangensis]|uniref:Anti-sigma factor antagonist n=1 Tax=Kocuria dechangensis TaxID=1176249 RepID=A0A917GY78_9MICC|nr:STAS domain-containing protein [Kocuria dechangensis]GGG61176.1 anti-sigma factor antagonist [Kocuria dechangensis]
MQFTVEHKPTFAHITGTGRLNMVGAPKLREVVAEVVSGGSNHVVVDLGGTEFMDSSGLGALIGCLKLARQAGGDLRIANVRPQVQMVLELTSMNRVLTPYDTADEAFRDA